MRKIGDIHVFDDPSFLHAIKRNSFIVLAAGVAGAALWGLGMTMLRDVYDAPLTAFELGDVLGTWGLRLMGVEGEEPVNIMWWICLVVGVFATLGIHELVHAFFFRQFAPPGTRVTFGAHAQSGMIFASAENVLYRRSQYLVIALAPSVVVTLLVVAIGAGLHWPLWTFVVATAHLSGCTGDWGYADALRRDPSITHCRDTEYGVEFYAADAPAQPRGEEADRPAFTVIDGGKAS